MPDPEPPHTYWEQPELNQTATEGANTATRNFKGDYADLLTFANGLTIGGSTYGGLQLRAVNITRTVASLATLRLEYGKETSFDSTKTATETSFNWSMKHTQRIVSLMRKTGGSASMPARGTLEAWKREPDPDLYNNFQYRNQVGSVMTLGNDAYLIAQKMIRGIEGAMRFYPTVQKVSQYTAGAILNVGMGLARISTPNSPWDTAAQSWLKVGDDVTVDGKTGTQTRTESWIGAKSWDTDLYGPNAWDLDG